MKLLHWSDIYPHDLHVSVLLLDNKIENWKISDTAKSSVWDWSRGVRRDRLDDYVCKTTCFTVNDDTEHALIFEVSGPIWINQWDYADDYRLARAEIKTKKTEERTMITRKRWTPEQDAHLIESYNEFKSKDWEDDQIFQAFTEWTEFGLRTKGALQKRYYDLTNAGNERKYIRKDDQYNEFLDGIQALKSSYDAMVIENRQLKKRNEELEKANKDFEVLARVMDAARRLVVTEELGEHEKPRFKMDGNGNLNRI